MSISAEPKSLTLDMSCSALVVIDMQNDFLAPEGWLGSVRGEDVSVLSAVVPTINSLSDAFRSAHAPVIHLNWGVRPDLVNLPANVVDKASDCGARAGYGDSISSGPVLVAGSWGAASVSEIDIGPDDICVSKHRLSGFRDNELDQILRRLGISTLFYTGVNMDRCVFATLMDGCFNGFDAVLVEDATASVSPDYVVEAIAYLVRQLYGFTTTSAALLSALEISAHYHVQTGKGL